MFSSLERVDFAGTANEPTGPMKYYVLTDHRDADTIQSEAAISVIFAITRCVVAHRLARADGARSYRVEYQLPDEPPAFFRYVITAAGASIVRAKTHHGVLPELMPRDAELVSLIADACTQLAAATWKRFDLEPSATALAAYENVMWLPTYDDDETGYYMAIVTLGALAASLLVERGMEWRAGHGVVPFVLGFSGLEVNTFGYAQEHLDNGPERPSMIVGLIRFEPLHEGHPFEPFTRRTGIDITPAEIAARMLTGRPDDAAGRALAQELALEAVEALRRWGVKIGHELRWVEEPVDDIEIDDVVVTLVYELVDLAHDKVNGLAVADVAGPLDEAIKATARRRGFFGGALDRCWFDGHFRSAARLQLRVPIKEHRSAEAHFGKTPHPFAEARFADTPNPFAPLLSVLATGYLVQIDEEGIKLIVAVP